MTDILKPKQIVQTESLGMNCEVQRLLGAGGQGEVYLANLADESVALKWYYPASATPEQRAALDILIKKGPPNEKFLWPLELVSAPGIRGFGYIMPLREARYKGMVDLMKRRVDPSFRALTTAGLELAHSFWQLHAKGLCYCDISFGNVFFDPATGEVLICDNDNVTIDGMPSSINGTIRFMAPEIVRNEAHPSSTTDLFSLAVLLFYMLMIHHPLEGRKEMSIRCFDMAAMTKIYGTEPVFIFDPNDHSNEPVKGYHNNALASWEIYPQFLQELFIKAFTDGIRNPQNRIRETVWRAAMVRLRDSIVYCPNCTAEAFYDSDALRASGGTPCPCWSCNREFPLPFRIKVGKNIVMLNHDTKLFPHHLDDGRMYDFSKPVAEVTRNPANPNIWGLKNLSNERWVVTKADGSLQSVDVGRSLTLARGIRINFGNTQGEIRY